MTRPDYSSLSPLASGEGFALFPDENPPMHQDIPARGCSTPGVTGGLSVETGVTRGPLSKARRSLGASTMTPEAEDRRDFDCWCGGFRPRHRRTLVNAGWQRTWRSQRWLLLSSLQPSVCSLASSSLSLLPPPSSLRSFVSFMALRGGDGKEGWGLCM